MVRYSALPLCGPILLYNKSKYGIILQSGKLPLTRHYSMMLATVKPVCYLKVDTKSRKNSVGFKTV